MTTPILAYLFALCVCAFTLGTLAGVVVGVAWCRKYEHPVVRDDGYRAALGMGRPPKASP
jgi:hypothetical protein